MAYSQYFSRASHRVPTAAVTDTSLPVFSGIQSLVANANGSLTASWTAATGTKPNFRYRIYISTSNSLATLFSGTSIPYVSKNSTLSLDIWEDGNGAVLQQGVTYYVGVRAIDSQSFSDTNTVVLSAVSQGVPATSTNNLLNQIISTIGTPANVSVSADIASVKSDTNGLRTDYTTARAAKLDNLDVAVSTRASQTSVNAIPTNPLLTTDSRLNTLDVAISTRSTNADMQTVLGRLTATRAGYLDNLPLLDVSISSRASQTSVTQIQNNTLAAFIVPERLVLPDSGTQTYSFYAYFYDEAGAPIDPDSQHVNVTVKDSAGGVISGPTLMSRQSLGIYKISTNVSAGSSVAYWYVFFNYNVASVAFEQVRITELSPTESDMDILLSRLTDTRASYLDLIPSRSTQSSVDAIPTNPLLTNDSRLNNIAHLDADISSRATQVSVNNLQTSVNAIPTNPLLTNDARLNHLDADISSRASQSTLDSYFGNMSTLADNLVTVQTALSADVVTLDADINTVHSDIGQCVIAANTALTAATTAETAAAEIETGIVTLNTDIAGLETVTTELSDNARILATSNLTGAVTEEDALVGTI